MCIRDRNTIGGTFSDILNSIQPTYDGGYILGGRSDSGISGDKTDNGNGGMDFWVVKLDSLGNIQWQNSIGGNDADYLYSIEQTIDSGYILGGVSNSGISGDKSESNIGFPGSTDFWVVKISSAGIIEWENTIGGSAEDKLTFIHQTSENGFIVGGYSNSPISGDKTETNLPGGDMQYDFWILKLDVFGNIEWQKVIGGFGDDYLNSCDEVEGEGYFLGGYSNSPISGNKTESSIGFNDYWVVKLSTLGEIIWQNTIGGISDDLLFSVNHTNDSGYILGGHSKSPISGDKWEDNIGFNDYWVVKLDSIGEIIWQNTIGGTSEDNLYSIQQTYDSGYILGGHSNSNASIDKSENAIDVHDFWVIKISSLGSIEWDNTIGGDNYDYLLDAKQINIGPTADYGFILGGTSQSGISGDKTEFNIGLSDYWVIKLSPEDCTPIVYYRDEDADGFGNADLFTSSCFPPFGYATDSTDCNDFNFEINPSVVEICNGIDDNCNVVIDEGLATYIYFIDEDDDGYGNEMILTITCYDIPPFGYVSDSTDCDDSEASIHLSILYYADNDSDLYGDAFNSEFYCEIFPPSGYSINSLDCDDSNMFVNPGSNEICNLIDDNCNSLIDEDLPTFHFFYDNDNDGYGNELIDSISCLTTIEDYVLDSTDCDDLNLFVYPGATEILNGLDDNCNNLIDEGLVNIESHNFYAFTIYPNPNFGVFNVNHQINLSGDIFIEIYDLAGQSLYTNIFNSKENILINLPKTFSGLGILTINYSNYSFKEIIHVVF